MQANSTSNPATSGGVTAIPSTPAITLRDLIVAQQGSAGVSVANNYFTNVHTLTNSQLATSFGANSDLYNLIQRHIKATNQGVALDVIALPVESGATASNASDVLTLPSTVNGNLTIYALDSSFTVAVNMKAQTVADVITEITDNLAGFPNLPVTATVVSSTTTVNAINLGWVANDKGSIGNEYRISYNLPIGASVTQTGFTGGATDPVVTSALDIVSTVAYSSILWRWKASYTTPDAFLVGRNQLIGGVLMHGTCYVGYDDLESNINSFYDNSGTPINTQNTIFMGNGVVELGTGIFNSVLPTPPSWRAVEFMAIHDYCLTDGTDLSSYRLTVSQYPSDLTGGVAQSSLAWYGIPLLQSGYVSGSSVNLFNFDSQNALATLGYTVIGVNPAGTQIVAGQVALPYSENTQGNPDSTFHFLNYTDSIYNAFSIFVQTIIPQLANSRLTENGATIPNRKILDVSDIRSISTQAYIGLGNEPYVLCDNGDTAVKTFTNSLVVTIVNKTQVQITATFTMLSQVREVQITAEISI